MELRCKYYTSLRAIETLLAERKSFAFESTLSGLSYLDLIRKAKLSGYYDQETIINFESFEKIIKHEQRW
jgi:predicted ABC-type ATPase